MKPWVPPQADAIGGPPVVLRQETFRRHEVATRYIEHHVRIPRQVPYPLNNTGVLPGIWGLLHAGDSITAANGLTLGKGKVTLCTQLDADLTDTGEEVTVYNAGEAIEGPYGGQLVLPLLWTAGVWSVAQASPASGFGNCDCPEATYEVDVDCGPCAAYYSSGNVMPAIWWLSITSSTGPYGYSYGYYDTCDIPCDEIPGTSIKLTNSSIQKVTDVSGGATTGYYGSPGGTQTGYTGSCTWHGSTRNCLVGELTLDGDTWKITIADQNGCVLGTFTKPASSFVCCGANGGWTANPYNVCDLSVSLSPDPCTCCPDQPPFQCPPPGEPVCDNVICPCVNWCNNMVIVSGMTTPLPTFCPGPGTTCYYLNYITLQGGVICGSLSTTECTFGASNCFFDFPGLGEQCSIFNGTYSFQWVGNCRWRAQSTWTGTQSNGGTGHVMAELTLSGHTWTMNLVGPCGQTASFQTGVSPNPAWDCFLESAPMSYTGGSCGPGGSAELFMNLS